MARVLDLSALRSFVAVAECGGVTRAANLLNLTQSAVSMQMKRLEDSLDVALLDRSSRSVALTAAGEQLLGYSRKMLALNDEAVSRLTDPIYEGSLTLGVPHDIVYPHIPGVLKRFNAEFPRVQVHLLSSYTRKLRDAFARGDCDIILTTEDRVAEGGEGLAELPLVWAGAPGGSAWKSRPLRLGFEPACGFRAPVQQVLDAAGIDWDMAVESDSSRAVEVSLSADLAVSAVLSGTAPGHLEEITHGGALPALPTFKINLYVSRAGTETPVARCADLLRAAYTGTVLRGAA
ncbi:MAG: LysR family transcriptional regulator [Rhodobacteraceae bacterium]|nr:LysR family transcriptional regulator [Paracoccaceae bacterium]